jgi:hypothetical protein
MITYSHQFLMERDLGLTDRVNGIRGKDLTHAAFSRLTKNLEGFGNRLNMEHEIYLNTMLHLYTRMAQGTVKGRLAFPLGTGLGKTSSIIAFLAELHHQGHDHVSVAVCAEQVETICSLADDLIANGVPESKIGLWHSKGKEASRPSTPDHDERQILLITHARVRGKGGIEKYNTFKGKPRTVLFWDESLIRSEGMVMNFTEIRSNLAGFKVWVEDNPPEVVKYLETATNILMDSIEHGTSTRLPELTDQDIERMKEDVPKDFGILKDFLDISQLPIKMYKAGKETLISYRLVIPSELKNIIILDASTPIRKLVDFDDTIKK